MKLRTKTNLVVTSLLLVLCSIGYMVYRIILEFDREAELSRELLYGHG